MSTIGRWPRAVVSAVIALAPALLVADDPAAPLGFVRVHVPHGRLSAVDLGSQRYVPMSAREFEAAVARLQQGRDGGTGGLPVGTTPLIDVARYEASLMAGPDSAATPALVGTASWTIGPAEAAAVSRVISLGSLHVSHGSMRTAAGTGDALVFGRADGSLAIAIPEPGDYTCEWRCEAADGTDDGLVFRLSPVPALASSIRLRLPADLRPLVANAIVAPIHDTATGDQASAETVWSIDSGPAEQIEIIVVSAGRDRGEGARLMAWSDVVVSGQQARLTTVIEPVSPWRPEEAESLGTRFRLTKQRDVVVTGVGLGNTIAAGGGPQWNVSPDGGSVEIIVPGTWMGSRQPVVVEALAPMPWSMTSPLPVLRVADGAWAGGGIVLHVDPTLVVSNLETERCLVVAPEAAARWPRPPSPADAADAVPGVRPSRVSIEQQGAEHAVRVAVEPRVADVTVSRVTTVNVSPDAVLGRTACEIRVQRGEAFEVRGRLAKGWFIDGVEVVPAMLPSSATEQPLVDAAVEVPEWRVIRDAQENIVRIAFAAAATPARSLTLRVTGHRAGVAPGVDITSTELDMLRLEGEGESAMLAVRTDREMTIDMVGAAPDMAITDPVLAALAADAGSRVRVRMRAGSRAPERTMRLVRRRPPLDVRTQVRLTARDGRLTESFTFECLPEQADLDSLVVHFSTVMDDRLEWSVLPPASGTVLARRIDPPGGRGPRRGEPIADSWVVELSPPASEAVTIRAACTVPFTTPQPIPLAWVEGATHRDGVVAVREAGRFRPRIVNRRLEELPPVTDAAEPSLTTVAEFAFDPMRGTDDDGMPAAEILPGGEGGGDDARAWAWRAVTTVWCHASGVAEYETRFDVENHGRATVALGVPAGVQVQGVLVDGVLIRAAGSGPATEVMLELPAGRRFVEVVVRALAQRPVIAGFWRIDPYGGTIDVPVFQREARVMLAPDVEIAVGSIAHREVGGDEAAGRGWSRRLLGATLQPARVVRDAAAAESPRETPTSLTPSGSVTQGYRARILVPVVGHRDGGGLLLVRDGFISAMAVVAAVVATGLALTMPAARLWLVACLSVLAAVGALWVNPPFDVVFRAAWWGTMTAAVLRGGGLVIGRAGRGAAPSTAAALTLVLAFLPGSVACPQDRELGDTLRVYLTPIDAAGTAGETALVPEPLFRLLARAEATPSMVRVLSCEAVALPRDATPGVESWSLRIDVDADAGTVFMLDQTKSGARVTGTHARVDGTPVAMRVTDEGRLVRVPITVAGRHRIELFVEPAVVRRGDIDLAVACLPPAPSATFMVQGGDQAVVGCEQAAPGGHFAPAQALRGERGTALAFDVSRAALVRVVRPVDPRLRLATTVRAATSRNDVFWDLDACRVIATFDIDSANEVVRSFVVRVDPGLGLLETETSTPATALDEKGCDVRPINEGRYLVERRVPTRGRFTVQVPLRMPLADPVGVFEVPGAWIEHVASDSRTTHLVPAPDLAVTVELPEGVTAAPRDADASLQGHAWRSEVLRSLDETTAAFARPEPRPMGRGPWAGPRRPVVVAERRPSEARATQQLTVEFAADQIHLGLQARIDATSSAVVTVPIDVPAACLIDRVALFEDQSLSLEAGDRLPVDIRWTRTGADRVLVVMQRPRSGRYRLEAEARLVGRPSTRGAVAVMRAALPGTTPMAVGWRTADGRGAVVQPAATEVIGEEIGALASAVRSAAGMVEMTAGEQALQYEIGDLESPAVPADARDAAVTVAATAAGGDEARAARVELADVRIVLDERGRGWGSVRFDMVAAQPVLRLALPAGMRLFEVLVDGRAVAAAPRDDGSWEVPLYGMAWPRSVLAVFAGEIGPRIADGAPFQVTPPAIVDLPCRKMLWTVHAPRGLVARVAAPARLVDAATMADERRAALERMEDEFVRAVQDVDETARSRMTDFVRFRQAAGPLPAEAEWAGMMDREEAVESRHATLHAVVEEPMDGTAVRGLVVRVGRGPDPTTTSRALATLVVIALAVIAWSLAVRWPREWRRTAEYGVPLLVAMFAVVWLLLFDPAWPGWGFLAVAAALAATRWRPRVALDPAGESTITQFAPPAAALAAGLPSTRTFMVSDR